MKDSHGFACLRLVEADMRVALIAYLATRRPVLAFAAISAVLGGLAFSRVIGPWGVAAITSLLTAFFFSVWQGRVRESLQIAHLMVVALFDGEVQRREANGVAELARSAQGLDEASLGGMVATFLCDNAKRASGFTHREAMTILRALKQGKSAEDALRAEGWASERGG